MVYSLVDKKVIMTRIQNLKSKKHYLHIYKIIKENNVSYSQNINGIFINLTNIEDPILDKIIEYLNYVESRNTEIDSEFYKKVLQ
jgi:uncharacterized UPF0160 family protein